MPYLAFSDVFNVMVDARDTDGNWLYAFQNLITGMFAHRPKVHGRCFRCRQSHLRSRLFTSYLLRFPRAEADVSLAR